MAPLLPGDVSAAARALLAVPQATRPALCRRLFAQAAEAHACVRRSGRMHPRFGNGTLMAAAHGHPMLAERFLDDAEYCGCLILVLQTQVLRVGDKAHHGFAFGPRAP